MSSIIYLEIQKKRRLQKILLGLGIGVVGLLIAWVIALLSDQKGSLPNILFGTALTIFLFLALFQNLISKCPSCGHSTSISHNNCHSCGKSFVASNHASKKSDALTPEQQQQLQLQWKKKYHRAQFLTLISLALMGLGLIGSFFFTFYFGRSGLMYAKWIGFTGVAVWGYAGFALLRCPSCREYVEMSKKAARVGMLVSPLLLCFGRKAMKYCPKCGLNLESD